MSDEAARIERVARALIDADPVMHGHHETHIAAKRLAARAAIAAMWEPAETARGGEVASHYVAPEYDLFNDICAWVDQEPSDDRAPGFWDKRNERLADYLASIGYRKMSTADAISRLRTGLGDLERQMTPNAQRICADCRFAKPPASQTNGWGCLHPTSRIDPEPDLVTGGAMSEPVQLGCATVRQSGVPDRCGPEGKHWEPRGFA